jgi:hypothetical protein
MNIDEEEREQFSLDTYRLGTESKGRRSSLASKVTPTWRRIVGFADQAAVAGADGRKRWRVFFLHCGYRMEQLPESIL